LDKIGKGARKNAQSPPKSSGAQPLELHFVNKAFSSNPLTGDTFIGRNLPDA
jgi:hypothetical protein